ncbi:MAG TPA: DedA family protein [Gemmatimonadales bacterium]|nr:DedA family protein [Gemmatimonadales bacterium]
MLEELGLWLVDAIGRMGYIGVVLLMAMESSVLPVPSELVMPPAGYLAARGEMNLWIALAAGTVGSCIGAYANYWVASRLGRWVFVRYGRWVLLSERSLDRTERFFRRHGEIATFVGRLFPVIRHLISIPAGLARMRLDRFFLYTAVGAAIWCAILLAIGWVIGRAGGSLSRELLSDYAHRAVLWLVPAVVLTVALYVWLRRRRAGGAAGPGAGPGAGADNG